jgi:hypothetical protein
LKFFGSAGTTGGVLTVRLRLVGLELRKFGEPELRNEFDRDEPESRNVLDRERELASPKGAGRATSVRKRLDAVTVILGPCAGGRHCRTSGIRTLRVTWCVCAKGTSGRRQS